MKMLLVWVMLCGLLSACGSAATVSPARHATPGIGWRSPATRMTEARIPLGESGPPSRPEMNSTTQWQARSRSTQANGGLSKGDS